MKTEQEKQATELRKAALVRLKELGPDAVEELGPDLADELEARVCATFNAIDVMLEMISWTPVDSTNLKAVRYHPGNEQLDVKFHNDAVYEYIGVQQGLFEALLDAESKGRYFNTSIKPFFGYVKRIK